MNKVLEKLYGLEGWKVFLHEKKPHVEVNGHLFPAEYHPFSIYSKLYREETNPDLKYNSLKRMHDLMWPAFIPSWNYWDEDRFREHCVGWNAISWAGNASSGKSHCGARLGVLKFFSDPTATTVIVCSTTLESLNTRIFGYVTRLLSEKEVEISYSFLRSKPPKILYDIEDKIHGIYAIAAKEGDDDRAIKDIIGRHPKRSLMIILDEAPDLSPAILSAMPNLEAGAIDFSIIAIGNPKSKMDLHGAFSTPKDGWASVSPQTHTRWETTQKNGICLLFSGNNSPAIHEKDPIKKEILSKFLITKDQLDSKAKLYGEKSVSYLRFVLGFWQDSAYDSTVINEKFLSEFNVRKTAEWGGIYPLQVVAGLDVAFSTGGDNCILRLGILGQDTSGKVLLDFRGEELLFKLKIIANHEKSAELQIAEQVIAILRMHNCPLDNLALDATGQGRALGEVIKLKANSYLSPIKIYSTRIGTKNVTAWDVVVKTALDLWTDLRDFIQTDSVRGLDVTALRQLTTRKLITKAGINRQQLESKIDYKSRMQNISPSLAHSPDEADSIALCLQAAKIKFGFLPGQKYDVSRVESFNLEKWNARMMENKALGEQVRAYNPVADFLGSQEDSSDPTFRH